MRTLIFLMDIRSRYMNQECFYHYKKVIKNIVGNLYYLQLQKKTPKIIMNLGINLPQIRKTLAILTNF